MKKNFLYILSVVAMLAVATVTMVSCSSDNETSEIIIDPVEQSYTILKETKNADFTSIVVEYTSVSSDMMTPQKVSGVITIPNGEIAGTILDNHYTITNNASAPSVQGATTIGNMVGSQFCIVATDYIGFGITKGQRQTYLCHDVCARNSIDLALVAQDILQKRGLNGGKLFNLGYSQGGAVALAVHRMMEKNALLASELNFAGSWCGDGPYDVIATFDHYLSIPDKVAYPVGLPLLVEGFLSSAPASIKGNLKFADFFTEKMNNAGLEGWLRCSEYNTDGINDKMQAVVGSTPLTTGDIFSTEMLSLDGMLQKKYKEFAKLNDLCTGWKPQRYTLKLIHNSQDDVVPVVNAENASRGLGLTGDACQILSMQMSHSEFGKIYYATAMIDVITMVTE